MTFEHVGQLENAFRKADIVLRVLDANADEGADVFGQFSPVDPRGVAGYHSFLFQLAHPLGDLGL